MIATSNNHDILILRPSGRQHHDQGHIVGAQTHRPLRVAGATRFQELLHGQFKRHPGDEHSHRGTYTLWLFNMAMV